MPAVVVVGAQWGDEGKGRVVDWLASQAHLVARYGGGDNAGHTVVAQGHKLGLHLVPSGILNAGAICLIGAGVVVNPEGARMQMEGCITMGLGYALEEEIRFRDGKILDLNLDTYKLPGFSKLPKIETILVDNPEPGPQGGGVRSRGP